MVDENKKLYDTLYHDNNQVFATRNDNPLNPSNVRRSLYRIAEKAGVTRLTFHQPRHSFASLMLRAGVPTKTTAEALGHSSTRVTLDIYSHIIKGMQAEALAKVRQLISEKCDE